MSEWIKCSDKMPDDSHDKQILLWNGKFCRVGICLFSVKYQQLCFYTVNEDMLYFISHWMPLPNPPEAE